MDLETWVGARVLRLSCTAEDLRPLGEAAELDPPVIRWNPRERAEIAAALDAAFLLLLGWNRAEAADVARSFTRPGGDDPLFEGGGAGGVLAQYDRLAAASRRSAPAAPPAPPVETR